MRRAFATLKYVPGLLVALSVLAWCLSVVATIILIIKTSEGDIEFAVARSGLFFHVHQPAIFNSQLYLQWHDWDDQHSLVGDLEFKSVKATDKCSFKAWECQVPFPLVVAALLPISLIPFARFPLWSYFAWTALIAAELAFYLR